MSHGTSRRRKSISLKENEEEEEDVRWDNSAATQTTATGAKGSTADSAVSIGTIASISSASKRGSRATSSAEKIGVKCDIFLEYGALVYMSSLQYNLSNFLLYLEIKEASKLRRPRNLQPPNSP
jgi:fructose-1,6-bisphosphatase